MAVVAGCGATGGAVTFPSLASPTDAAAPAVLEVRCDGESTIVSETSVAAGEQGVQVQVTGPSAGDQVYLVHGRDGQLWGGDPVRGDGRLVLVLPPGDAELACQYDGHDPVDPVVVAVTDPLQLYDERGPLTDKLDCENIGTADSEVHMGRTAMEAATRVANIAGGELGARDGGYPDQSPQEFLVVRDGRAIGTTQAFRSRDDSWSAGWNSVCG